MLRQAQHKLPVGQCHNCVLIDLGSALLHPLTSVAPVTSCHPRHSCIRAHRIDSCRISWLHGTALQSYNTRSWYYTEKKLVFRLTRSEECRIWQSSFMWRPVTAAWVTSCTSDVKNPAPWHRFLFVFYNSEARITKLVLSMVEAPESAKSTFFAVYQRPFGTKSIANSITYTL